MELKRGDVYWVNFDPSIGGEITKIRPAVVISNNANNRYANRVQVVPVTSNTEKIYPTETMVFIGSKKAKAMADQLTTVSKLRIKDKITSLTNIEISDIERAIKLQLGLSVY